MAEKCKECKRIIKEGRAYYCGCCDKPLHLKCGEYISGANESDSSEDANEFYCKTCYGLYKATMDNICNY